MSAGGAAWSQSSRLMLFGGERPPTFHVATNILLQEQEELFTVQICDWVWALTLQCRSVPIVQSNCSFSGVKVNFSSPRVPIAPPWGPLWINMPRQRELFRNASVEITMMKPLLVPHLSCSSWLYWAPSWWSCCPSTHHQPLLQSKQETVDQGK